jgi:hypothetical protein
MNRTEEIRQAVETKVATFAVGDMIAFTIPDITGCNENTGDPIEIDLIGKIITINGQHATVEHKYGICNAWLAIAKKL